jgi:MATE family multidrug resistance protein
MLSPADRAEARALAKLAAPVVVVQTGLVFSSVIDTIMVGHVSEQALAAVAIGNVYQWGLLIFGQGVLGALDPLAAQAFGAGDSKSVARALQRGLVVAAGLSIAFWLLFQLAQPVLVVLRQPPELVPTAAAFVRAVAPSIPAVLFFTVMRQTLQAMSITRPALIAVIAGNVANVIGNWILIFGHLGAPALGAVGSAISTSISRFIMVLVLLVAGGRQLRSIWRRPTRALLELSPYARLLELGIPIGVQLCLENWVFMAVSLLMGSMGSLALSGHQIAINLASLSFMVPMGVGGAASTRVGNALGRADHAGARRAALVALGSGAAVMSVSALCFGLLPELLARAYTPDPRIISAAITLIPIAALFQVFDGTQVVGCGILRGAGDTRAAAIISLFGYWALAMPIGLLLAFPLGLGPRGLWWGLTAGLATVAVLLVARVRRRFPRVEPVAS